MEIRNRPTIFHIVGVQAKREEDGTASPSCPNH
jgi:hypothetical protein